MTGSVEGKSLSPVPFELPFHLFHPSLHEPRLCTPANEFNVLLRKMIIKIFQAIDPIVAA
jgi:hypothetical protein